MSEYDCIQGSILTSDQISLKNYYNVYYSIDIKHYSIFALKKYYKYQIRFGSEINN
uniref:Uncharacterized protein n=1 Tax=Bartonella rochalimae ATCC BAA-1498 TaxID=685782 RepID=E6YKR9_9HYPH|nr:hypothetical protein BARRO_30038 [Bartonella rochalimae ATCC BAA-1498]